jgi:excisionase family DNA binding protein
MDGKTLLSRREAAEKLGLSTDSIDRLVASGKLRPIRFGSAVRFAVAAVERLAQEGAATRGKEGS